MLADESGCVQFGEMSLFLDAVYSVVFALHAEVEARLGKSAAQLAAVTTAQVYSTVDLETSDGLSWETFSRLAKEGWFPEAEASAAAARVAAAKQAKGRRAALGSLGRRTHLERLDFSMVFAVFDEMKHVQRSGAVSRDDFNYCFGMVIEMARVPAEERETTRVALSAAFDVFDANGDGVVSKHELVR